MNFEIIWKDRLRQWELAREKFLQTIDGGGDSVGNELQDVSYINETQLDLLKMENEGRQLLSRKVPVSPSKINPYRVTIIFRFIILVFFLQHRWSHPVHNAHSLWLASVICEVWFSVSWILDQLPKWQPVNRETYPERLCMRYNPEGKSCNLASIDVLVTTTDPKKESPLMTSNTILSILAVEYPTKNVSCYVSDDGAALLTLETLSETCKFARIWVPFCKKFNIEPRSPEIYFSQKFDISKHNVYAEFPKERRNMKVRLYEEFKIQINGLTEKFQNIPPEGLTMKDGSPWPGNDARSHPAMIQIMMGSGQLHGNDLPQLTYVSRERYYGFKHNGKAGAMNALLRVSALLTNGAYVLNLDCGHYINNSKAFLEAMCFLMDPTNNRKICFVQFPQRFDSIDARDRCTNPKTVFYDITLKSFDGIQGPLYVGTGCFFDRKALYGYEPPSEPMYVNTNWWFSRNRNSRDNLGRYTPTDDSEGSNSTLLVMEDEIFQTQDPANFLSLEKSFGCSPLLITSNFSNGGRYSSSPPNDEILREAINVISSDYEDNTAWGKEIGWIYGSHQRGQILTCFKMHVRGWRSIYCSPASAAFRGFVPSNLSERLSQVLVWATGSIEILVSSQCPIWYGYGGQLKLFQRIAYISATTYPITSIPLLVYSILPAICLFTGRSIISLVTFQASIWIALVLLAVLANGLLEIRWSGVSIQEWWRNQQFWAIAGVSAHFLAIFRGIRNSLVGISVESRMKTKTYTNNNCNGEELDNSEWKSLLILPMTLIFINFWAMIAGAFSLFSHKFGSLGVLLAKLFFASLVVIHLHPILKGLLAYRDRIPAVVIMWSLLLAGMFSVLWVRFDPFTTMFRGPSVEDCGIQC
ncbi:Cellulose synthase [Dillenia turbinata]|uniref:Cellulose synthase n=1 Tax=Dillenia turbinata TaxID=194707 RepID=A0AAN8VZM7_9MAGN